MLKIFMKKSAGLAYLGQGKPMLLKYLALPWVSP